MKRLFLALSLALAVMSASAIPAKRGTWKTLKLADGSEVRAELRGDEFGHYWQTEDGRRFIINAETGTAEAADVKAMKANAAEKRKQASQRRLKRAPRAKASTRADDPVYEGEKKGLIILVQFDDVKFKAENTPEQFRRIANEEGFAEGNFTGSVKDYFKAQSYGRFTIDFDVAGPVTMPNGYAYYGENGIFGTDKTGRIGEMIEQACRGVEGQVDFNDYDWDGDGEADQVYVLYAGHGEADTEDPNTIWPHEYELRYALGVCPMVGGVYINTYACGPELGVGDYTAGIGTICHEFSHCLGFPDMYDTDDNVNYGTGYWDVMCMGNYNNDSFTPASYTSLERWYAGWIEPTVLDTDTKIENLGALETTGEAYVLYNERDDDEYYLIENRQHEGWDAGLPGAGMLILHVDFDELTLENVSFRYPKAEKDTLTNINLTLHNGEKLAVVGLNGAGKTTLVKLMCGFLDPTQGRVLLNGTDIRKFNRQQYYDLFSAVFQNFSLLATSVAANVAQSEENIDMNRVRRCVELAGLKQKVESLPQGYESKLNRTVYEDAVMFSGGETQRLMLARALYKNAPFIVLDEPTAALDPLAEADMYQKYDSLSGGKSSVYISHRLASTRFCDRIVLIDNASICEEGTHEQLLKAGGKYARLFEVQSKYYKRGGGEVE